MWASWPRLRREGAGRDSAPNERLPRYLVTSSNRTVFASSLSRPLFLLGSLFRLPCHLGQLLTLSKGQDHLPSTKPLSPHNPPLSAWFRLCCFPHPQPIH